MAKQRVWLTFDLGVRGDYDSLYQWLDEHQAVECGNGVATFEYDFEMPDRALSMDEIVPVFDKLKNELKDRVGNIETKGRVYALTLIHSAQYSPAGVFLFGSRKISPWDGFANKENVEPDV